MLARRPLRENAGELAGCVAERAPAPHALVFCDIHSLCAKRRTSLFLFSQDGRATYGHFCNSAAGYLFVRKRNFLFFVKSKDFTNGAHALLEITTQSQETILVE